jgi:Heat induced stress protein YflT domain
MLSLDWAAPTDRGNAMHGTSALTRRRIVATFDSFGEAQATIERLQDANLGEDHATILAEGLRLVGRSRDASLARPTIVLGAATGAVIGILLASAFALFAVPSRSLAPVILIGLVVGLIVGSASGWLAARIVAVRGRAVPRTGLDAERFSVVVDEEVADRAVGILRMTVAMQRPLTAIGGTRPWAPTNGHDDAAAPPQG